MATQEELNLLQQSQLPPDLLAAQQQLNRQQRMAEMLMQQNQQPQGQMISGRYVAPAWTQQLAPVVNQLTGAYLANKGDEKATALAQQLRTGRNAAEESIINKMTGTPAQATELAGPYTGNIPKPMAVQPAVAPDLAGALREIGTNQYGAGKDLKASILKSMMPDPTTLEREFKSAQNDPIKPFKGSFNEFKNQMSDADKARINIDRARLNLAAQEQAWNLGLPMSGGVGGGAPMQNAPQAPLQTINQGSPILAPNQQLPTQGMPQQGMPQGQMPRFNSKMEQDLYLDKQKKINQLQADAQNALPGALNTVNSGLQALNGMLGDTSVDAKGNVVYGKQEPHPGFHGAVGISGLGSGFGAAGFLPATDVTDFKSRFEEIKGKSFLEAVGSLRGTGAISEIEGAKATAAINRMSLSQSEAEFVRAADDLRKIMLKGYTAAQQRAGAVPINLNASPTIPGAQPKMKYNLQTGQWE
jgi:hypothetical protein